MHNCSLFWCSAVSTKSALFLFLNGARASARARSRFARTRCTLRDFAKACVSRMFEEALLLWISYVRRGEHLPSFLPLKPRSCFSIHTILSMNCGSYKPPRLPCPPLPPCLPPALLDRDILTCFPCPTSVSLLSRCRWGLGGQMASADGGAGSSADQQGDRASIHVGS